MVKIDKDVPIPSGKSKFPFLEMELNDSFYTEHPRPAIQGLCYYWSQKTDMKFTCRAERKGTRVWRVA